MAKTLIKIESTDKRDIDLFFQLLPSVGIGVQRFSQKGNNVAMFQLDFKKLHQLVTNQRNITKQDTSINTSLISIVGLYRNSGMTFQEIGDKMNEEGYTNSRGNQLNKMQVNRLYKKYEEEQKKLLKK